MDNKVKERLVSLLYILQRDYIQFGQLETVLQEHVHWSDDENVYSNKFVEQYARSVVDRLVSNEKIK